MTNLTEVSNWDASVYQVATADAVVGGPGGIANLQAQALADRALWIRNRIAAVVTQAGLADGTADNQQLAEAVVLQVPSVPALRAVPIPTVAGPQTVLVMTRGQNLANDGLSSMFSWNAASTAADNGSTVIQPTASSGAGRWILAGINALYLGGEPASYYVNSADLSNYVTTAALAADLSAYATLVDLSAYATLVDLSAYATLVDASNATNLTSGAVPAGRLPNIGLMPGITIQADPGGTPSGAVGDMWFYY
jgi:hypothetical protein